MKKFTTEWHLWNKEKPEQERPVVYAITYNQKCEFPTIVGLLRFTTDDYLMRDGGTEYLAWAYIDDSFPKSVLKKWEKENIKSEDQIRLEKIQELERQIEILKEGLS